VVRSSAASDVYKRQVWTIKAVLAVAPEMPLRSTD
jgi:hypothetical protein